MERHLTWTVDKSQEGKRLIDWLREKGCSKQVLSVIKNHEGSLLNNGEKPYFRDPLQAGDVVELTLPQEQDTSTIVPVRQEFSIIYEDEDLMVINKPADLPIHPSMNNYTRSLGNGLAWYFSQKGQPFVFRCINRLDHNTSGLTIVAKHLVSGSILATMVRNREIHREYLGISRGHVTPSSGTITAPLGRKPGSIIERTVDFEKGESAVTHYRVIDYKNGHSLLSLTLETGRTHQIRIHMKYLGFPLVGDSLYNPDMEWIFRQALHAARLVFRHPITGEQMEFHAPMPDDMRRVLEG